MRIAVVNWSRREVGGVERYLSRAIPELALHGHDVALLFESALELDRVPIALPEGTPEWSVAELGPERALAALRAWAPDLLYVHIVHDPGLEAALLEVAPAVMFAHGYYGACISGTKMLKHPVPRPCDRRFGWRCLLHYYPDRCGGLSPFTMLRDYRRMSKRERLLGRYRAVVTNSAHVQSEYARYLPDPSRVRAVPLPVTWEGEPLLDGGSPEPAGGDAWRLAFLGRMDLLKGGRVMVDALPLASEALGRPIRAVFAGDGPDRPAWEQRAREAQDRSGGLRIDFPGWTGGAELEALWSRTDLLVVPSLWPEPFGLVGPEAGLRGVPVAAFGVGGVRDWLIEGVNGYLAPGDPPTAAGLADAIVRCLRDPAEHARLRRGAVEVARRFAPDRHMDALLAVFAEAARG